MLGGIAAAVAILFFVTAHEAGHFFAAKSVGIKATRFFFGFGPTIWSTKRGETEYGVKAIPLGGWVRIVGMSPLEEVAPEDIGRTYREKKFWEKSVVVLAGVGINFLIGFILFYGVLVANGVNDYVTTVDTVVAESPAADAGMVAGDQIVAIGDQTVSNWDDLTAALAQGPGPTTVTVLRDGEQIVLQADLAASDSIAGSGYLGVSPSVEHVGVGPIEGIGYAGKLVGGAVGDTFYSLYQMFRPSSLSKYVGVLGGNTDIPEEIRPVSPVGIVAIGTQAGNAAGFLSIMAYMNVILATINLIPLLPLDGGHFAIALYEKIRGRAPDMRKLMPLAAATMAALVFLFIVGFVLDIVNPINLG